MRPLLFPLATPLALALTLALSACGPRSAAADYFPLEDGHRWTYRTVSEWDNDTRETEALTLRSLGSRPVTAARSASAPEAGQTRETLDLGSLWQRRSGDGVDYWLRADASGIYRLASGFDLDEWPVADAAPRYVLKMPLATGTTWQASTTAYLLRRRSEFPPEIRHSHPVLPMTYTIDALNQTVTVPAGRWDDCVRVTGIASVRLFSDGVQGWKDFVLTTREWYCQGVGLVKLEREEPANSTFLVGGRLTMELMSWD